MLSTSKKEPGHHHFVAIMNTIFGQNPEVCEVKMGFSHRVSHFHAPDPHQSSCRIVLNTISLEKVNRLTFVALVNVRTLRDVNFVKCTFSMLTSLTS